MSPASSTQRGAVLALVGTILLWGYSWIVMKQVLAYAGPFDFAALRYLIGAAILFAALKLSGQSLRPPPWPASPALAFRLSAVFLAGPSGTDVGRFRFTLPERRGWHPPAKIIPERHGA